MHDVHDDLVNIPHSNGTVMSIEHDNSAPVSALAHGPALRSAAAIQAIVGTQYESDPAPLSKHVQHVLYMLALTTTLAASCRSNWRALIVR